MQRVSKRLAEHAVGKGLAVALLVLGLLLTGFAWHAETQRVREEAQTRLLEQVNALAARMRQRLVAFEVILRAGASLFAATDSPTRAQWSAFVETFDLARTYPGVQAVAYAARLRPDEIAAFEERAHAEGFADFHLWPSGPRSESGAIEYIEPMNAANVRALGFDLASDPDRRQAMNTSRDQARPMLSPSVVLVQDAGGARRVGVVMFLAVYRYPAGVGVHAVEERRQAHRGWVYVVFRPADVMASIERNSHVRVRLYDSAKPDPVALLYQEPGLGDAQATPPAHARVAIQALDRVWTLEGFPAPGVPLVSNRSPWVVLIGGTLASLLLFGVLWTMATTRDRAHALASSMTLALRRVNEELELRVRERTADLSETNQQLRDEAIERQRVEREREAALRRERDRTAQLRALADAGLRLGDLSDDAARLDHLADRACEIVACRHVFLVRDGEDGSPVASVSSKEPLGFEMRRQLLDASARWPKRDRIAIVRARSSHSDVPAEAWPEGCHEAMIVPVRLGVSEHVAMLYLLHGEGRRFSAEDEVVIHQLVLLVMSAMATASAVESERHARREAETANKSKDEFLAIVSHELRTPLHAILGWLQVLKRRGVSQEHVDRAIEVIRRNAQAQSTLIDDLLDLARIERGKLAFEFEHVSLDALVAQTVESLRQTADSKGVVLDLKLEARGEVHGDPVRLQQAIANLVSNAVKFSDSAGRVGVRLHSTAGALVLEIEDEGEGIDSDVLPHVFERFTQGDPSGRRRHGGVGIGLALVKHIVEAHGGTVSARSAGKGRGALFIVQLPAPEPAATAAHASAGPAQEAARAAVLVVDPDEISRDEIVRTIDDDAFTAVAMESIADALTWLEACDDAKWPVAMLCCVEADGCFDQLHDALRALEARRGRDASLPVAALAGHADASDRAHALACGFVAWLPKPVSPEHLQRVLGRMTRSGEPAPRDAAPVQAPAGPSAPADLPTTGAPRYRS